MPLYPYCWERVLFLHAMDIWWASKWNLGIVNWTFSLICNIIHFTWHINWSNIAVFRVIQKYTKNWIIYRVVSRYTVAVFENRWKPTISYNLLSGRGYMASNTSVIEISNLSIPVVRFTNSVPTSSIYLVCILENKLSNKFAFFLSLLLVLPH